MFNEFDKNTSGIRVNRRAVLRGATGLAGVAVAAPFAAAQTDGPVQFTHGVASGDPLQDRVILWTRAAPSDGGARNVTVEWQVAEDKAFQTVAASGSGTTGPAKDFTFKVDAAGLTADRAYYYRFVCEGVTSDTGRTRTLAATGTDPVSLAVVSCSNYPQGFFHVYKEISQRDVAMVLHLGDYLYEYPAGGYSNERMTDEFGRKVDPKGEVIALDDYRRRYALYRSDPDLQAVHAAHPFICVWDDHEIANDTWRTGAENHNEGEGPFEARKKAALQAYHEWLPIRDNAEGDQNKIYRSFELGDLASLIMLDTRLVGRSKPLTYGADLPLQSLPFRFEEGTIPVYAPDGSGENIREVPVPFRVNDADAEPITNWDEIQELDPKNLPKGITYLPDLKKFKNDILPATDRSMLGDVQQAWFDGALQQSSASGKPWQIIGQQVLSGKVGIPNIPDEDIDKDKGSYITPAQIAQFRALAAMGLPLNLDAWDGYPAARDQLFASIKQNGSNAVMLAGDTHNAWAFDLADADGEAVAVEFATAGVSSPGMEEYLPVTPENVRSAIMAGSPELKFLDSSRRGWLELDITAEAVTARFQFVSTVREPEYAVQAPTIKRVSAGAHKLD